MRGRTRVYLLFVALLVLGATVAFFLLPVRDNPSEPIAGGSSSTSAVTSGSPSTGTPSTGTPTTGAPSTNAVDSIVRVVAFGDTGLCGTDRDQRVAELVESVDPDVVLAMGDLAYNSGTIDEYANCWEPVWGGLASLIRTTPGNHDYVTEKAAGYFTYFGDQAGSFEKSWYSFDIGQWHVASVDSNCSVDDRCSEGSEQMRWLEEDLVGAGGRCVIVFSHHPRFSSGYHGDTDRLGPMWELVERNDVELVLAGHEHSYERFAPQDADGHAVEEGPVQIVAGTGGAGSRGFLDVDPDSAIRVETHGILILDLDSERYSWEFRSIHSETRDSQTVDSGTAACDG